MGVVLGKTFLLNLILDKYLQLCFPKFFFHLKTARNLVLVLNPNPDLYKNLKHQCPIYRKHPIKFEPKVTLELGDIS